MQITGTFGGQQAMALALSEDQKGSLAEILSRYSPEEMTKEEMQALRDELREAGIPMTRETLEMLKDAGFDPRMLRGVGQGRMHNMQGAEEPQTQRGELWSLYRKFQDGEISEDEFVNLVKTEVSSGSLIKINA